MFLRGGRETREQKNTKKSRVLKNWSFWAAFGKRVQNIAKKIYFWENRPAGSSCLRRGGGVLVIQMLLSWIRSPVVRENGRAASQRKPLPAHIRVLEPRVHQGSEVKIKDSFWI